MWAGRGDGDLCVVFMHGFTILIPFSARMCVHMISKCVCVCARTAVLSSRQWRCSATGRGIRDAKFGIQTSTNFSFEANSRCLHHWPIPVLDPSHCPDRNLCPHSHCDPVAPSPVVQLLLTHIRTISSINSLARSRGICCLYLPAANDPPHATPEQHGHCSRVHGSGIRRACVLANFRNGAALRRTGMLSLLSSAL